MVAFCGPQELSFQRFSINHWLAENMVKSVKQSLSKSKFTKDATVETHIACFLASYCNTCHSTTARTPAELLFNQAPRTCLSLVNPCTP